MEFHSRGRTALTSGRKSWKNQFSNIAFHTQTLLLAIHTTGRKLLVTILSACGVCTKYTRIGFSLKPSDILPPSNKVNPLFDNLNPGIDFFSRLMYIFDSIVFPKRHVSSTMNTEPSFSMISSSRGIFLLLFCQRLPPHY